MTHTDGHETEMELAFLAKGFPVGIAEVVPQRITDIYLSDDSDLLTKLRLRSNGNSYELTKKVVVDPSDLSIQDEYNTPLSQEEFKLFASLPGRKVVKDRYKVNVDGDTAEIDIFQGLLRGFVLIEFEFINESSKSRFIPPEFCGREVTQEDFIAGAYLAGKSYSDISRELDSFGYSALYIGDNSGRVTTEK